MSLIYHFPASSPSSSKVRELAWKCVFLSPFVVLVSVLILSQIS